MDRATLAGRIDHTVLGPATGPADVDRTVAEAAEHGMNVCVPPCHVPAATEAAPGMTVVTVVGFPHGQHATATKVREAERAHADGADELDVVCNVGRLLAGERAAVREELAAVVGATPLPVKVIVETGLLEDDAKRRAASVAAAAGADYVKTSTGFGPGGATVGDVELLADHLPVKASGGIGDYATARDLLAAGAQRLGTSAGVAVLEDAE